MGEKRGNTNKMRYDFNSARCLEVELNNTFYRVTPNEFRSFGGNRRILNVDDTTNVFYEDYEGPVYYLGSNKVVPQNLLEPRVMFLGDHDPRNFGKRRRGELHWKVEE